jgi:hypothetical protein
LLIFLTATVDDSFAVNGCEQKLLTADRPNDRIGEISRLALRRRPSQTARDHGAMATDRKNDRIDRSGACVLW